MKLIGPADAAKLLDTTSQMLAGYHLLGVVNNQVCAIGRLLYHWTIYVDLDPFGYRRRYCYTADLVPVVDAFFSWNDGELEPKGWSKDVQARIYQDPETGKRWSEDDVAPEGIGISR